MKNITPRQERIINFIRQFLDAKNYPPSIRDIVKGCGISSTSVVSYNLNILAREGYIHRYPDISRGIELIHLKQQTQIPIIGQISAGKPFPVQSPETWDISSSADTIDVPVSLTKGHNWIYALKVKGYSMIDALINDGDIILMQYVNSVDNGEMAAVWLKAEREATLKKVYVELSRIRLQPANKQMKAIYTTADNVEIQGRVIGVIRQTS